MCGRYLYSLDNKELKELFDEAEREIYQNAKEGVIYPSDIVPILINKKGVVRPVLAKWGLTTSKGKIINSRIETVQTKPTTRKLIESNKCLIPASAFYEWKKINENYKEKYIFSSGNTVLYFAGMYNISTSENKQISMFDENTCTKTELLFTILTKDASQSIKQIHDRMPVIISQEEIKNWLLYNSFDVAVKDKNFKLNIKKTD